ncbi:agamous-like MADS-box protein AGL80 [Chenopodium quinoa]|nr:agamous-like MADS-box protein AGL80 [Chenopodium quinoa]
MTRKKVKLAFIANDSARKATYKKRKRGLLKKMDELTTLCDVKACAILYSPYETRPVVWPAPSGAKDVIASFKRLPEMEKVKKMVSQEEFLRQRVAKAHEQLKKQQKDNREKDMTHVMYQCLAGKSIQNMSLLDLSDLTWVINQHLGDINKRVDVLKKENIRPNKNNNNNIIIHNKSNANNNTHLG